MVGIVVVSHSRDLARAAVNLALQMVHGPAPRIEIAAGTSDDRLGTDPTAVAQAVVAADAGDGVVVIMDLGSAVLSAELALEFLPESGSKTRLVPAAFVEGIFAAVISAAGGAQVDAVARDAEEALDAGARALVRLGRTLRERVHTAVHVAVGRLVELADRFEHLPRLLGADGRIQVRERLAVDLLLEDREVGATLRRIELLPSSDGHGSMVLAHPRATRAGSRWSRHEASASM